MSDRSFPHKALALIIACFILSAVGCSVRPSSGASSAPAGTPAPVNADPGDPTPSPTPEPTPIPFDLAAEGSSQTYSWCSSPDEVRDAILAYRADPSADPLREAFAELPVGDITAVRLRDQDRGFDVAAYENGLLYRLSNKDLIVCRADGQEERLLSVTGVGVDWTGDTAEDITGYEITPLSLFPVGDRLAILCDWYGYENVSGEVYYKEYTALDIYDVSDPAAPTRLASFGQDGAVLSAGAAGSGIWLLTEYETYNDPDPLFPESFLPRAYVGGEESLLTEDRILVPETPESDHYLVAGLYDLSGAERTDIRALLGFAADARIQDGQVFLLARHWAETLSRRWPDNGGEEIVVAACTDICALSAGPSGIEWRVSATVNGSIPGLFALDVRPDATWYAANLFQGRYVKKDGEDPAWTFRETGERLALADDTGRILASMDDRPIRWAGFLGECAVVTTTDEESWLVTAKDGLREPRAVTPAVNATAIFPWADSGYIVFYRPDSGALTVSVRDELLREQDARSFGSDHSNTLENPDCYFLDGEADLLAFAADDSYCVYGYRAEDGLYHRFDLFLNDWAWNARAFVAGNRLYVSDGKELIVCDLDAEKILESVSFR